MRKETHTPHFLKMASLANMDGRLHALSEDGQLFMYTPEVGWIAKGDPVPGTFLDAVNDKEAKQ